MQPFEVMEKSAALVPVIATEVKLISCVPIACTCGDSGGATGKTDRFHAEVGVGHAEAQVLHHRLPGTHEVDYLRTAGGIVGNSDGRGPNPAAVGVNKMVTGYNCLRKPRWPGLIGQLFEEMPKSLELVPPIT